MTKIKSDMNNAASIVTDWFNTLYNASGDNSSEPYYPAGYPSGYTWLHIISSGIAVTLVILLIIIGNFLVIYAVITDRNLKGPQNLFIASLAFADLGLGLLIIPFALANELMGYWFFGRIWCELWKAIDVLFCTASISSLCLISLDRYWSITRAMSYSRQRTPKRAAIMIMIVWIISATVCIPPLIGWKQPAQHSGDWPLCLLSEDIGYVFYSSIGSFYIPAFIMVFVYFKIWQAAKERARKNVKRNEHTKAGTTKADMTTTIPQTETPLNNRAAQDHDAHNDDSLTPESSDGEINNKKNVPSCPQPIPITDMSKLLSTDSDSCEQVTRNIRVIHNNTCLGPTTVTLLTSDNDTESSNEQTKALLGPGKDTTDTDGGNSTDAGNGKVQTFTIVESKQNGNPKMLEIDKVKSKRPGILPGITRHLFNVNRNKKKQKAESSDISKVPDYMSADKHKRKLAKARERRATLVLGLVMAAFILCWGPFFTMYLVSSFCKGCIGEMVFTVFFWIGYCNSALNPLIYTVFNRDFKRAFQKIICGKKRYGRNR